MKTTQNYYSMATGLKVDPSVFQPTKLMGHTISISERINKEKVIHLTIKEIHYFFTSVKSLLLDKNKWTKKSSAKDEYGSDISTDSPDARQWCLMGAFSNVITKDLDLLTEKYGTVDPFSDCINFLVKQLPDNEIYSGLAGFNDHPRTEHKEIIGVLDKGINILDKYIKKYGSETRLSAIEALV